MRHWRDVALCRGLDPEIFFPDPDDEEAASDAIEICGECPARELCLEWAIARREKNGVWGGATVRERRRIIRRRRRSA